MRGTVASAGKLGQSIGSSLSELASWLSSTLNPAAKEADREEAWATAEAAVLEAEERRIRMEEAMQIQTEAEAEAQRRRDQAELERAELEEAERANVLQSVASSSASLLKDEVAALSDELGEAGGDAEGGLARFSAHSFAEDDNGASGSSGRERPEGRGRGTGAARGGVALPGTTASATGAAAAAAAAHAAADAARQEAARREDLAAKEAERARAAAAKEEAAREAEEAARALREAAERDAAAARAEEAATRVAQEELEAARKAADEAIASAVAAGVTFDGEDDPEMAEMVAQSRRRSSVFGRMARAMGMGREDLSKEQAEAEAARARQALARAQARLEALEEDRRLQQAKRLADEEARRAEVARRKAEREQREEEERRKHEEEAEARRLRRAKEEEDLRRRKLAEEAEAASDRIRAESLSRAQKAALEAERLRLVAIRSRPRTPPPPKGPELAAVSDSGGEDPANPLPAAFLLALEGALPPELVPPLAEEDILSPEEALRRLRNQHETYHSAAKRRRERRLAAGYAPDPEGTEEGAGIAGAGALAASAAGAGESGSAKLSALAAATAAGAPAARAVAQRAPAKQLPRLNTGMSALLGNDAGQGADLTGVTVRSRAQWLGGMRWRQAALLVGATLLGKPVVARRLELQEDGPQGGPPVPSMTLEDVESHPPAASGPPTDTRPSRGPGHRGRRSSLVVVAGGAGGQQRLTPGSKGGPGSSRAASKRRFRLPTAADAGAPPDAEARPGHARKGSSKASLPSRDDSEELNAKVQLQVSSWSFGNIMGVLEPVIEFGTVGAVAFRGFALGLWDLPSSETISVAIQGIVFESSLGELLSAAGVSGGASGNSTSTAATAAATAVEFGDGASPVTLFKQLFWACAAVALVFPLLSLRGVRRAREGKLGTVTGVDGRRRPAPLLSFEGVYMQLLSLAGGIGFFFIIKTLLGMLACNYTAEGTPLYQDPTIQCWRGFHLAWVALAIVSGLLYYPLATFISPSMAYASPSLDLKYSLGWTVAASQAKLLLSAAMVFFPREDELAVPCAVAIGISVVLSVYLFTRRPCLVDRVNLWRGSLLLLAAWPNLLLLLLLVGLPADAAKIMLLSGWALGLAFTVAADCCGGERLVGIWTRWVCNGCSDPQDPADTLGVAQTGPGGDGGVAGDRAGAWLRAEPK
ncbi:hypothetical protein FNF27_01948 [Cafeteria roenbergensis]|uniref:Uncharacterized protein n=2 Tax=Cafeteria roenbergensis TaxID=33653 RepID=A0A5A8EJ48_CAFRO|nr:hypothetical protein FNF27_01948 [Cafeteria roenbergensis]